ncbi:MAG: PIN domain-containing protein [Chitinophagaceae bacterium]|nr:PIN domain-containing protein [Chitinophagaceae bacterium]
MQGLQKCCIDSCVWVKYAGHFKTASLLRYISENNLLVYADNYLLGEVHEALISGFGFTLKEADQVIRLISPFVIIKTPRNVLMIAKDAEDNYLYDLCIQNNCRYLITIDKAILTDVNAPFIRKTDAWLKRRIKK